MRFRIFPAVVAALAAAAVPADTTAQAVPPVEFSEFTLDNGLRFIVHEDRSTPVVAVEVWYDVGSANDPPDRSGFAHLFEHMLFQETENIPLGRMMEMIPEAGGTFNGSTADDRTNYYETLPSNRLNLALWMEAERMGRLVVSEENMERETEVVKEERRRSYETQPYAEAIGITLDTLASDWPPYDRPGIGSMADLEAADVKDVREFHRTWYTPNNATVAVAGDVSVEEVRRFAEEYFSGIPRGPDPPSLPPMPSTPRTDGERRVSVVDELANTPLFAGAYNIPPAGHQDIYALELLASIFSLGESSRLNRRLVKEEGAALVVQAGLNTRRGPGILSFFSLPNQGVDIQRIESLVEEEIAKLSAEGVTPQELEKARNQKAAELIRSRLTVQGKAGQLQRYRFFHGDPAAMNTVIDRYRAVTLEDVERVARDYLVPENRTVVIVEPGAAAAGAGPQADENDGRSR